MAQDTTEQPNTLTLRINAGAEYVIQWLVNRTADAFEWMEGERPDGTGVRLNAGVTRRKLAGQSVSLRGWSMGLAKGTPPDDVQTVPPIDDAIEFKVRALSTDRCEVVVSRIWPEVDSYLVPVLESMAESYPECRPAIDRHLGRSGEPSPAGDQGKIESPAGIPTWPTEDDDPRLLQIETEGDRPIVARWNRQNPEATAKQIGKALTLAEGTVYNRIGIVKQDHPELVRPRRNAKRVSTK